LIGLIKNFSNSIKEWKFFLFTIFADAKMRRRQPRHVDKKDRADIDKMGEVVNFKEICCIILLDNYNLFLNHKSNPSFGRLGTKCKWKWKTDCCASLPLA